MYSLGIDIGGTKTAVVLGRGTLEGKIDGFILDKIAFPTEVKRGVNLILEEIYENLLLLLQKNKIKTDEVLGIGISCGGPLDSKKGIILSPPNLPGFDNIHIVDYFKDKFNLPVRLQNDANACAVAEWMFGAAKGRQNAIFLTFGTGMGAGLILDGKLYSGTSDMAGEVGHIRLADYGPLGYGKHGSFEGFCSGGGIQRMGQEMAKTALSQGSKSSILDDIPSITAKTLAIAANNGDDFALSVYKRCAEKLGLALSILIDILNPEIIVIGSIYERNKKMFDSLILPIIEQEALKESRCVCEIAAAKLGDEIGDFAALSLALL